MANNKLVYFDANPLLGNKTGIGYLCESLITSLAESHKDTIFIGHYFNFLNKKDTRGLPRAKNIRYIETRFFPTKVLNMCRRIGLELPLELFTLEKFDILLFTNFVSFPTIRKSKHVLFVHDLGYVDHPEYTAERNGKFLKRFVPRSIKRSSLLVTISEFSKQRLHAIYNPATPIITLPVPVKKMPIGDISVFKKHRIPKKYILFVGTLEPRKNLTTLLDAVTLMKHKETGLVIAGGKGWKDEELLSKIKMLQTSNHIVIQTGYVTEQELVALYENALLYIQPSHYEGFGMPIIEAMGHGVPVVCSDLAVFREIAGSSAQYFDANDASSLAGILDDVLSSPAKRAQMQKELLEIAKNYASWSQVAKKFYKDIDRL